VGVRLRVRRKRQRPAGDAGQCALIGQSAGSTLPTVATISLNAQSFDTSGLDAEARYSFDVAGGAATVRPLANYLLDYEQSLPGTTTQDLLGDISYGLPKLQGDLSVQFTRGETIAVLSGVYVGAGSYRKSMSEQIQNSHVPDVWYVNAAIDQRWRRLYGRCSVYAAANNLFDRDPPHAGFGIYTNIDSNLLTGVPYDRIGRFFKIGVRIEL
jgi:iron complex outermembrane recepter protein